MVPRVFVCEVSEAVVAWKSTEMRGNVAKIARVEVAAGAEAKAGIVWKNDTQASLGTEKSGGQNVLEEA